MDLVQQILIKMRALPLERQREVPAFTEDLASREGCGPRVTFYGSCTDIRTDLGFEDFAQNRQEMWGKATDTELDREGVRMPSVVADTRAVVWYEEASPRLSAAALSAM